MLLNNQKPPLFLPLNHMMENDRQAYPADHSLSFEHSSIKVAPPNPPVCAPAFNAPHSKHGEIREYKNIKKKAKR